MQGMPRRYYDYLPQFHTLNLVLDRRLLDSGRRPDHDVL